MPPHSQNEASLDKSLEKSEKKRSDYFELKIPRPVFRDIEFSPLLIIMLIAFSFLLGMQTARIRYMDKDLARLQAVAASQTEVGADPNKPVLGEKIDMDVGKLPTLGKQNAKVTMIEFSDFQCPYCKRFYDETFRQLKKDYIDTGKVRFAFRHLPLDIHPLAPKAAEASECANDQKKFWEYHSALFEKFDSWVSETADTAPTKLTEFAGDIGLNTEQFSECLSSGKYTQKVTQDKAVGEGAGATGTPTFFINGQKLVGAFHYQTFKTILDQELKK